MILLTAGGQFAFPLFKDACILWALPSEPTEQKNTAHLLSNCSHNNTNSPIFFLL